MTAADAYVVWEVLSHVTYHLSMAETDKQVLAEVIESSGLRRGTMPVDLLDDLMASVRTSEAQLAQLLGQDVRAR